MKHRNVHRSAVFLAMCVAVVAARSYEARGDSVDPIGTMIYLVGEVGVHRDGSFLDEALIDIGLEIEDYDLVETGDTGQAQIDLVTPATRSMTVTIDENTAFYFDIVKLGGTRQTSVEMLSGSIALKVRKVSGDSAVFVRTPSIVMGVRGTEFTVTAAPDGSYLVTCSEGEVVCRDNSGAERVALAGRVVEKTDDDFRSLAVPVTELERYATDWAVERERIFRTGASVFIRSFARQYRTFEPRFVDALNALLAQREVFEIWRQADRSGVEIPQGELLTQRAQVTPAVIAVRSALPVFEQLFYRLKVLQRYHEQGIGRTTIDRGYTSTAFFESFSRNSRNIEQGLAVVRYYLKLYARMSGYEDPGLLEEILSDGLSGGPPAPTDPRSF
jgi:hypothetical protein